MTLLPWVDCRETHLSAVYMAGDRVLKLKKPVSFNFVDLTSLDARERVCHEEVRLNSRLSSDVCLGVAHLDVAAHGEGEPVVLMRRLSDDDQLTARIGGATE